MSFQMTSESERERIDDMKIIDIILDCTSKSGYVDTPI